MHEAPSRIDNNIRQTDSYGSILPRMFFENASVVWEFGLATVTFHI